LHFAEATSQQDDAIAVGWFDEDGDLVNVVTEADWIECMRVSASICTNSVLKLKVTSRPFIAVTNFQSASEPPTAASIAAAVTSVTTGTSSTDDDFVIIGSAKDSARGGLLGQVKAGVHLKLAANKLQLAEQQRQRLVNATKSVRHRAVMKEIKASAGAIENVKIAAVKAALESASPPTISEQARSKVLLAAQNMLKFGVDEKHVVMKIVYSGALPQAKALEFIGAQHREQITSAGSTVHTKNPNGLAAIEPRMLHSIKAGVELKPVMDEACFEAQQAQRVAHSVKAVRHRTVMKQIRSLTTLCGRHHNPSGLENFGQVMAELKVTVRPTKSTKAAPTALQRAIWDAAGSASTAAKIGSLTSGTATQSRMKFNQATALISTRGAQQRAVAHAFNGTLQSAAVGVDPSVPVSVGTTLPLAPIGFGMHGPGVSQLQLILVQLGLLRENDIAWRHGTFGMKTAAAIGAFQGAPTRRTNDSTGTYTAAVRQALLLRLCIAGVKHASFTLHSRQARSAGRTRAVVPNYKPSWLTNAVKSFRHRALMKQIKGQPTKTFPQRSGLLQGMPALRAQITTGVVLTKTGGEKKWVLNRSGGWKGNNVTAVSTIHCNDHYRWNGANTSAKASETPGAAVQTPMLVKGSRSTLLDQIKAGGLPSARMPAALKFHAQLTTLKSLGFAADGAQLRLLTKHGGSVLPVVAEVLEQRGFTLI
jgi:hypothetical protein